ncbi:MAG: amidohydrolase family protein [Flavobacteriales bacterium]|nr:amidohydrolase family protein [Flavobacteriales bacterium]
MLRLQAILSCLAICLGGLAQDSLLITNVRIFNGITPELKAGNVLVVGGTIAQVGVGINPTRGTAVIDGSGRTLMPGLIDAHAHITLAAIPMLAAMTAPTSYVHHVSGKEAEATLLRGFTTIRDVGGPTHGLKMAIDQGLLKGPRIYPSGAMITQSGGHGDFRMPHEIAAPCCASPVLIEKEGIAMIADGPDAVRQRVREQLALGASQIKLMAGGGVSSLYDPLDVTQYTPEEFLVAVEAAENWGTYVTVHAYTPRAIRFAIENGVKCIEHGQLADEEVVKLMAAKGVWWSLQPFLDDEHANPKTGESRKKQLQVSEGTDRAYALAKKHKVKTAWGTDVMHSPNGGAHQGAQLVKMTRWYTPFEVLKMATADNGELMKLSGPRDPYPAKLGVIDAGAWADLLLVNGDPLRNLELLADPERNLVVIIKNGKVVKDIR